MATALKELKAILSPVGGEKPAAARDRAPREVSDLMGLFAGLASRPTLTQADARTAGNNSHAEPADLYAEALAPCLTRNHDGD